MSTFITVGNGEKSFLRLFINLERFFDLMPQPIIAQCGSTEFKSPKVKSFKFIELSKFKENISKSKLIICHAGMGTMLQSIQANKFPVCIPRMAKYDEIINDHQVDIAKALGGQNKIIYAEKLEMIDFYIKKSLEMQRGYSQEFINKQKFHIEFENILNRINEDLFRKSNPNIY